MNKLTRQDLYSLEEYAEIRPGFRTRVLAHKKSRMVKLGDHATLYFEDRLTVQYQIQEMLRIEKIFEGAGIQEELDAYNPLIPDGANFKATFMIEYPDAEQRRDALAKLIDIEDRVWVQAAGLRRIHAIADEDLERSTDEKTSAVHFLRFELTQETTTAIKKGAGFGFGIDHPEYTEQNFPLNTEIRESLAADLE
jgi:hypothetical protein